VGSLVLGISFGPCYSRRRVASLSESPLPTGPEVPKKEIQPPSGVKDRLLRSFGISAHTPCTSEVRPSALRAAGPCRTIRSVMRG
jgi:hypothetical protein